MLKPSKRQLPKFITILLGLYVLAWISLEGRLWQSIVLAAGLVLLGSYLVYEKNLARRRFSRIKCSLIASILGTIDGLLIAIMTLFLMAIKTGLHSHGPEFAQSDFYWVIDQIPLWSSSGFLAGLGISLLLTGARAD